MPFKLLTRIEGSSCRFTIERLHERLVLMCIDGHDIGEFGDTPMRCVDALLPERAQAEFFVDARAAQGIAIDVSGDWARWLARRRDRLSAVHMLTSSRFVSVSAEFVRRFSELEAQMQLYRDPRAFEERLVRASAR